MFVEGSRAEALVCIVCNRTAGSRALPKTIDGPILIPGVEARRGAMRNLLPFPNTNPTSRPPARDTSDHISSQQASATLEAQPADPQLLQKIGPQVVAFKVDTYNALKAFPESSFEPVPVVRIPAQVSVMAFPDTTLLTVPEAL